MVSSLNALDVTGVTFVIVVAVVVIAEILKALTSIFSFLANRFLGVKTRWSKKKELDEMIANNRHDLESHIQKQETFNQEIKDTINSLKDTIDDTSDVVVSIQVENLRNTILEFASYVANGRIYTKEQFNYVRKLHDDYEKIIEKRGLTNDEVNISYRIIERAYEDRILKGSFIEDRMNDPKFQEEMREALD